MEQKLSRAILILFRLQNGQLFMITSDRNPTQTGTSGKENLIVPVVRSVPASGMAGSRDSDYA